MRVPSPPLPGGGACTRGPPSSCQRSLKRASSPWPVSQLTSMRPSGTDSEPYFMALVHNSWRAIDRVTATLGSTLMSGPRMLTASECPPQASITSRNSMRKLMTPQDERVMMSCAPARAVSRRSNASTASSACSDANDCRASAWTMARVFLTRWSSSWISRSWASLAMRWEVMSTQLPK